MISRLAPVTGVRSQSPYRPSIWKPAPARRRSSDAPSRKRRRERSVRRTAASGSCGARRGGREGDHAALRHRSDLVRDPESAAGRVLDGGGTVRAPLLPGAGLRVPGLEGEEPAGTEGGADRDQRGPHLLVGHQALEGVAHHRRQCEPGPPPLSASSYLRPVHVRRRALEPLDVGTPTGAGEGRRVRVHPDETAGVAVFPGAGEHGAGAAAHVQDGVRVVDQCRVEGVGGTGPRIPGAQHVVQGCGVRVREHGPSVTGRHGTAAAEERGRVRGPGAARPRVVTSRGSPAGPG